MSHSLLCVLVSLHTTFIGSYLDFAGYRAFCLPRRNWSFLEGISSLNVALASFLCLFFHKIVSLGVQSYGPPLSLIFKFSSRQTNPFLFFWLPFSSWYISTPTHWSKTMSLKTWQNFKTRDKILVIFRRPLKFVLSLGQYKRKIVKTRSKYYYDFNFIIDLK